MRDFIPISPSSYAIRHHQLQYYSRHCAHDTNTSIDDELNDNLEVNFYSIVSTTYLTDSATKASIKLTAQKLISGHLPAQGTNVFLAAQPQQVPAA